MKLFFKIFFLLNYLSGQSFFPADPYNLVNQEMITFNDENDIVQFIYRPQIIHSTSQWRLKIRAETFYNSSAPNLENMSDRFIARGISSFTGLNLSYIGELVYLSLEPFYFYTQNNEIIDLNRVGLFSNLNDTQNKSKKYYNRIGFRETQFYLTYKDISIGISNANMWWGPGLHTSLTMTNNTIGFPHLIIGTLRDKHYKNIKYNFRYVLSQLNKTKNDPYYTAFAFKFTFSNDPILTIGFNRNILLPKIFHDNNISTFNLATILFRPFQDNNHTYQTLALYTILDFPKSGLKIFFEIGTTDKWNDFTDFLNYPDHGVGSIFGFRQYGLFNNEKLFMGFEYARLVQSSFWDKRPTPNWYGNSIFDYSSYDNRRWAAHSGSDSDDLYIYFGYQNNKFYFMPALNFERHGVLYSRPAEVKMEIRLDFRYKWKDYWFNIYFEREWLEHAGFIVNKWRIGNVLWFGIERDLSNMLSDKIRLINK